MARASARASSRHRIVSMRPAIVSVAMSSLVVSAFASSGFEVQWNVKHG